MVDRRLVNAVQQAIQSVLRSLFPAKGSAVTSTQVASPPSRQHPPTPRTTSEGDGAVRIDPDRAADVKVAYAPNPDGDASPGEVVWAWVPYEEGDGRGKDRPLLAIASKPGGGAYAIRLTSKAHPGDRDLISIGSGAWDSERRESWADLGLLFFLPPGALRRESVAVDRRMFDRVARALTERYGW